MRRISKRAAFWLYVMAVLLLSVCLVIIMPKFGPALVLCYGFTVLSWTVCLYGQLALSDASQKDFIYRIPYSTDFVDLCTAGNDGGCPIVFLLSGYGCDCSGAGDFACFDGWPVGSGPAGKPSWTGSRSENRTTGWLSKRNASPNFDNSVIGFQNIGRV